MTERGAPGGGLRAWSRRAVRPLQLATSLVLLSIGVLLVADFLGLREDPDRRVHESRKALAVVLGGQLSTLVELDDGPGIERALSTLVARNADVGAAQLVLASGVARLGYGELAMLEDEPGLASRTHLDLPIFRDELPWGEVRIAFVPDASVLRDLGWLTFVTLGSLASFGLFLGRALVQLDPGRAVPERVDSAFDLFSAGVVILDENLRIVMANDAATAIVGPSSRTLIGRSLDDAFPWEVEDDGQAPWKTTLHSGVVASDQALRLRGPDGESRLYSVSCAPVGNDSAGQRGVLVTLDDMTSIERSHTELATTLRELRRSQDVIEARNERLELLATTDPLTEVANRRTLLERLVVAIDRARAEGGLLACVMTDIDHFKQVNDTYGHGVGDAVIRAVADTLRKVCRKEDLVARFGGEEFVLVLPGLDAGAAAEVAERARIAIIALAADEALAVTHLSASFGVSELDDDMQDAGSIVDAADRALYAAKEGGRNRVAIHGDDTAPAALARVRAPVVASESDRSQARLLELETLLQKRDRDLAALREFDALTGMPMRILFLQRVATELVRAERAGTLVGIMAFELRDLGRVISTFGHAAAESLVLAFVARLQEGLRANDLVSEIAPEHSLSRITSNEYGVLLADLADAAGALIVVARLKRLLSQPFTFGADKVYLGANIGIALSVPGEASGAELVFGQASDARVEAAAKPDKVSHSFAAAELDDESHDHIRLESDLRDALESGALEVWFQPKFDLARRRVTGMEALLRWKHDARGFVPPDVFVAVAEANGLIGQLSALVLERTLAQIVVWRAMGFTDLRVSINVSPMQLRADSLVDDILDALARTGVPGHQLEIELTETSVLDCPEEARRALGRLRADGVGISIDDFGTGYTSLSLLAELPLDSVKIDRSFIAAMEGGERYHAIVESIITMAHALQLRVVGEGIETDEQLDTMARLGCDEIQGYLISRPLPADEITAFLVHRRVDRERKRA